MFGDTINYEGLEMVKHNEQEPFMQPLFTNSGLRTRDQDKNKDKWSLYHLYAMSSTLSVSGSEDLKEMLCTMWKFYVLWHHGHQLPLSGSNSSMDHHVGHEHADNLLVLFFKTTNNMCIVRLAGEFSDWGTVVTN